MLGVEQLRQALTIASIDVMKHREIMRQENIDALFLAVSNQ